MTTKSQYGRKSLTADPTVSVLAELIARRVNVATTDSDLRRIVAEKADAARQRGTAGAEYWTPAREAELLAASRWYRDEARAEYRFVVRGR